MTSNRDTPPVEDASATSAPTKIDATAPSLTLPDQGAGVPLPRLAEGTSIGGRYRVLGLLGRGGFGEVYRVTDERAQGTEVALKLYRMSSRNEHALEALKGEFALLAHLSHPNLARVHDFGWVGEDVAFFTQDVVEGCRLDGLSLGLEEKRTIRLLAQLCRALDYLHDRGILHRDVKPSNILVDLRREHVTLLDFGISRAFGRAEAGILAGTHAYMSPEAIRGGPVDARSDLYSLGVTLYRLASHHLPFASSGSKALAGHLYFEPPALRPDEAPAAVAEVIERLLGKEPGDRYATAAEVLDALSEATGIELDRDTTETLTSYVLSARFVGHESLVDRALGAATADGVVGVPLLVQGAAGTGKSRVLREVQHRAQLAGHSWIVVEAHRGGDSRLLLPELAKAVVTPPVLDLLSAEDRVELARGVPELRRRGERIAIAVDPEVARRARIRALGRAMGVRFAHRPGVVAVEDLHWANEGVVDLIADVVRAAREAGARCQFLATSRPGEMAEAFRDRTDAQYLLCEPLLPEASAGLVASMFGDPRFLEATTFGRVVASDAHPVLWVQESLRLAVEEGDIVRRSRRWVAARDVPARPIEVVLAERVRRLSVAARAVALSAAILGHPATVTELISLTGRRGRSAAGAVAELVRAGILEARRSVGGRVGHAMHDRFVEAVIGLFPARRVAAARRRAARLLHKQGRRDPLLLARSAEHLRKAGDVEAAAARYERAAEVAEELGRPDLAHRLLVAGWPHGGAGLPLRIEIRCYDLALTAGLRREASDAIAKLRKMRRRASAVDGVEIDIRLAADAARRGAGPEAARRCERALRRARELGLPKAEVRLLRIAGDVEFMFGKMDRAFSRHSEAGLLAREHRLRGEEARAYLGATLAALQVGRGEQARVAAEAAERASKAGMDGGLRSDALRQLGNVFREEGSNRKALALYRRAVKVARQTGSIEREAKALNNLGTVAQWVGQVDEAGVAFQRSIELKERTGATVSALLTYNNLGALHLAMGRHAEAAEALRMVVDGADINSHIVVSIAHSNLADLAAIQGRLEEAMQHYEVAHETCSRRDFAAQQSHALAGLARTHLMRGTDPDLRAAEECVASMGQLRERLDLPEAERRYHTTCAMLADARGQTVRALSAARLAVRSTDRETQFSDIFGTSLEARWIMAIMSARAGRVKAADAALRRCRRILSGLAVKLSDLSAQRDFILNHPIHLAIDRGDLDPPRGWTWCPAAAGV